METIHTIIKIVVTFRTVMGDPGQALPLSGPQSPWSAKQPVDRGSL